jgi:CheY-like chemotaxis protein
VNTQISETRIRVLIADDDENILACYRDAFSEAEPTRTFKALDTIAAELFDPETTVVEIPKFEIVACRQGDDAIVAAAEATNDGQPFDVVILDVRMPPGIDGVEAGCRIRALDPDCEIVFVTGFSDLPREELERRVPPPMKLHYFNKPLSFMQLAEDVAEMVRSH